MTPTNDQFPNGGGGVLLSPHVSEGTWTEESRGAFCSLIAWVRLLRTKPTLIDSFFGRSRFDRLSFRVRRFLPQLVHLADPYARSLASINGKRLFQQHCHPLISDDDSHDINTFIATIDDLHAYCFAASSVGPGTSNIETDVEQAIGLLVSSDLRVVLWQAYPFLMASVAVLREDLEQLDPELFATTRVLRVTKRACEDNPPPQ